MTYKFLSQLPHDHPVNAALGRMVIAWSGAETVLAVTLSQVSKMPLNMAIAGYYRMPTFESRKKFILALIPLWQAPDQFNKTDLETAIENLARLSSTRNGWVHGTWVQNPESLEIGLFDYRAAPDKLILKPVKVSDIQNHIETVTSRSAEIERLCAPVPWH